MKQIIKKCLSIFLSALILITYMPSGSFAQTFMMRQPFVQGYTESTDDFAMKQRQIKFMLEQTNKAGSDLIEEISDIQKRFERLVSLVSPEEYTASNIEELKTILVDYRRFLINLEETQQTIIKLKNRKITPLDLLARRYAKDVDQHFVALHDYYLEEISKHHFYVNKLYGVPKKEYIVFIRKPYNPASQALINPTQKIVCSNQDIAILEMALKDSFDGVIKDRYWGEINKIFSRLSDDGQGIAESKTWAVQAFNDIRLKARNLLSFSTPESKTKFLKSLANKVINIMEENNPGSSNEFLKALFIREGDTAEMVATKLQRIYVNSAKKVTTVEHMISLLNFLNGEQRFAEYLATSKSITVAQKELIKRMQDFAAQQEVKALPQILTNAIEDSPIDIYEDLYTKAILRLSKRQSVNASAVVSKSLSGVAVVVGSLFILNMIVRVDATGNSFVNSINPAILRDKMENGTATNMEKYAFYMHPSSSKYIIENPVQFASVILPIAEAATNPVYAEIMNDPIMQIKDNFSAEKAALERQLNKKLEIMEIPQSVNIELPQI